jgi:16S rRNA (cytosine967-C5)-methyltransferase
MDLGSQLIVAMCSGPVVVDYCAGAGGKAIALADRVAKVIAHDASKRRLEEARKRSHRFGQRNVTFPKDVRVAEADLVLLDAPCSGSGSLAREPQLKWKITEQTVKEFAARQSALLDEVSAAKAIVYATCSVLREENEAVVEAFLRRHPRFAVEPAKGRVPERYCEGPYLRVWPQRAEGGGFFAARLTATAREP